MNYIVTQIQLAVNPLFSEPTNREGSPTNTKRHTIRTNPNANSKVCSLSDTLKTATPQSMSKGTFQSKSKRNQ